MRLTGVKTGDLVRIDDGLPYHAEVLDPPADRRMRVRPIGWRSEQGARTVKTNDVVALWRKSRTNGGTK